MKAFREPCSKHSGLFQLLVFITAFIFVPVLLNVTGCDPEHVLASEADADFDMSMVPDYSGTAYSDIHGDVPFFSDKDLTTNAFQEYWELDKLGRCTGAYACIGPESLPSEPRGNSSTITPAGWHSVQYEGIDGGYLYNRCHLIGSQLTGVDADERNIITGTRYMNIEGMLPFENSVYMYVEGTGNHVIYRVRPCYVGEELIARGVLMEARSVEDPLIQFCAFCYNVQPGVKIDYATGESTGPPPQEGETLEAYPISESEDMPAREVPEVRYILNINTKKFHYPQCSSVGDMKEKNKRESSQSREEIIEQGYQPCKRCKP